jgi:tRNA nucleotidyltransferase/poly(A) polymerase
MASEKEQGAFEIVKHLADNGHQALYAGGYVRDMLLHLDKKGDIDIATDATPEIISGLFPQVIGVGEHFGVMIVVKNSVPFEVATFRSDIGIADGRRPRQIAYVDAQHDALRRDFTINGMFFDPLGGELLDYVHGREDLDNKLVRSIGDPRLRFEEDYLRLVRGIRFAARFGFAIEADTWAALREKAVGIMRISAERIFQELDKILTGPRPDKALVLLSESGLLKFMLPEISDTIGMQQPEQFHPEGDVFVHTVKALSLLDRPTHVSAWSVLLHDIGKPPTLTISDRIRFSNHQHVGAKMAQQVLARLKAPNSLTAAVCECIDNHMNFMNVTKMRLSTLKKFLSRPTFEDEMELHRVDCLASHGDISNYEFLRQKQREIPVDEVRPAPLLTGKDLIAMGHVPGPEFKKILGEAYDAQLEGTISTQEQAIEWAKKNYPANVVSNKDRKI